MRFLNKLKLKAENRSTVNLWFLAALFISLCLAFPQSGLAAWGDDAINVSATPATYDCRSQVVYDDAGGYYVVWRDTTNFNVYALHYDANGDATWDGPLRLSPDGENPYNQDSTADGSGGLLVAWNDVDDDTRVQRVSMDGTVAWTDGGIKVLNDEESRIAADGTGGAIVMSYYGVFNRIAADGTLPWGAYDSPKEYTTNCTRPGREIVSDGNGGAILLWREAEMITEAGPIVVQRVDSDGNFLWNSGDPVELTASDDKAHCPRLVACDGGAIVVWGYASDNGTDYDYEVRAQKVDSDGDIQWTAGGVVAESTAFSYPAEDIHMHGLATDGAGGVFLTWVDWDAKTPYAQYVNTDGTVVWDDPVALTSAGDMYDWSKHQRHTVEDGMGGFINTWVNYNDVDDHYGIAAQRCNAAGEVQWTDTGVLLGTADYVQYNPRLASNGQGGAVIAWVDEWYDEDLTELVTDVFMQGVSAAGVAGDPGYTVPADDEDTDTSDDTGTADDSDDSSSSSGGSSGGCFVSSVGAFSVAPATGLLFLFAGIVGLATVRRR